MESPAKTKINPVILILVLIFIACFIANGLLVYFARSSWNGLVSHNAYREGLAHNQELAAQRAQQALGWQGQLMVTPAGAGDYEFRFVLRQQDGTPLTEAVVQGVLFRPVQEGHDLTFTMTEQTPGVYASRLTPPMLGLWDFKVMAEKGEGRFKYLERVTLPTITAR